MYGVSSNALELNFGYTFCFYQYDQNDMRQDDFLNGNELFFLFQVLQHLLVDKIANINTEQIRQGMTAH